MFQMEYNSTYNENQTNFDFYHPSRYVSATLIGMIGCLGLPGNVILMSVIQLRAAVRKPHEWLIFALSLNDFVLCLTELCLGAPFMIDFENEACKVAGFLQYHSGTLSFLIPPLVAFNRYVSLYHNDRYNQVFTNKNVFLMSGTAAVAASSWVIPFAVTGNLGMDNIYYCGTRVTTTFLAIDTVVACSLLCCSYGILLYFSFKVIQKIRDHKKNAFSTSQTQTRLIRESRELITVTLLISTIPLLGQVPVAMLKIILIFVKPFNRWVLATLLGLFPLTSAINGYITIYVIKDYRKAVLHFAKKHSNTVTVQESCL